MSRPAFLLTRRISELSGILAAHGGIVRINEFRRVGINKPSSYITCFYGEKGAYECSVTNHTYQRGVASGETPYLEDVGPLVNTIEYNEDLKNGTMDMRHDPISVKYIEGFAAIQDRSRLPITIQYTSQAYFNLTTSYNITQSMSRRGNPHDNALAENFFSILKTECIHRIKLQTFEEARNIIDEYIDFYNNVRIQLKTKLTPLEK